MRVIRFFFAVPALAFLSGVGVAADNDLAISARMRALNEVPPNSSKATAQFRGTINRAGTMIEYTLQWNGLTTLPLFSHIHFGPTKINGGIMVFLCGDGGKPACVQSTSGEARGIITASDIVGPGVQGIDPAPAGLFADVLRAIETGNGYANLHTTKYTGGEVRGQVILNRDRFDDDDHDEGNR